MICQVLFSLKIKKKKQKKKKKKKLFLSPDFIYKWTVSVQYGLGYPHRTRGIYFYRIQIGE